MKSLLSSPPQPKRRLTPRKRSRLERRLFITDAHPPLRSMQSYLGFIFAIIRPTFSSAQPWEHMNYEFNNILIRSWLVGSSAEHLPSKTHPFFSVASSAPNLCAAGCRAAHAADLRIAAATALRSEPLIELARAVV